MTKKDISPEIEAQIRRLCPEGKCCQLCSRWDCTVTYKCNECGWIGLLKDAVHDYQGYPINDNEDYDVEPIDECPICGSENIEPKGVT